MLRTLTTTLTTTLLALLFTTGPAHGQEPAAPARPGAAQAPEAPQAPSPSDAERSEQPGDGPRSIPQRQLGNIPNRRLGNTLDPCPSLKDLPHFAKSISDVTLDISVRPEMIPPECRSQRPSDCATGLFARQVTAVRSLRGEWSQKQFHWAAAEVYHQQLYFEDIPLERYGQSYHPLVQPWLSGARFFATFPIIPYKMGIDRPHDHIYTLGYYRPGSYSPCVRQRLPWEWDAAGMESAAWLALIVLLP